jgi:hypothetical protein
MKDKTNMMNRDAPVGTGAEKGYEKISNSQVPTRRAYKRDQLEDAALWGNPAIQDFENPHGDEDSSDIGGFLPRNNYSDRF